MRREVIESIEKNKIVAIIRGVAPQRCLELARALYAGGIRNMEITFPQHDPKAFPETAEAIRTLSEEFAGKAMIGAGTVTSPELVDLAADAGARFIVSPNVDGAVIARTLERELVSLPGALTPTEVLSAHDMGADFVKLFPANVLGTRYISAIRAPISHVKMLAVGGIGADNAAEYLRAGMCGIGVGGSLVNEKWIAAGEFDKLTAAAAELVAAVRAV